MKKYLFTLFIFTATILSAQVESENKPEINYKFKGNYGPYTFRQVEEATVFPECGNMKENKPEAFKCINNQLKILFNNKLKKQIKKNEQTSAVSKIRFIITKEGKITDIKSVISNDNTEFDDLCVKALNEISEEIGHIEPAKIENIAVNMIFEYPVKLEIEEK